MGFTLAEVLITLGIIGFVAAMTLPPLIQKQQKMVAVNQLKATYSLLYQALNRAKADYGEFKYWTYYDENYTKGENSLEWSKKYLIPYIKNVKVYNKNILQGCSNNTYHNPDGSVTDCNSVVGFCRTCNSAEGSTMTQIHLPNGAIVVVLVRQTFGLDGEYVPMAEFHFDINGFKGPNVWGKDVFRTQLAKPYRQAKKNDYVLGHSGTPFRDRLLEGCKFPDKSFHCFDLIQGDGWEIKDDYPWK